MATVYTIFIEMRLKSMPVSNTVNAWVDPGLFASVAASSRLCNGNASYDYDYGGKWTYYNPECKLHQADTISEKEPERVFITTQYTETDTTGSRAPTRQRPPSSIARSSGTLFSEAPQCGCRVRKTIFPLGVEEMVISFQHSYRATDSGFPLRGDSNLAAETDGIYPLETVFTGVFRNRSDVYVPSGQSISLRLSDWLLMANVTLDEPNTMELRDARADRDHFPFFRTTGVSLQVRLEYSNKNRATDAPDIGVRLVTARAAVERSAGWAGLGALPDIHVVFPSDADPHTYRTISRYRQGVLMQFSGAGVYYHFDLVTVMMALITGAVLIGVATLITDLVAVNMYKLKRGRPVLSATSKVLRAKRMEVIRPKSTLSSSSPSSGAT